MRWARTADQHIRTMAQYRKQTSYESEQWEHIHFSRHVLGEGTLKAGRIQKSHQDGRPGPPLHSWKYPILVKTRAILPSCHLSFLCCKCELKIRAQKKDFCVSFESAVKRQDLTFGILRYHLICDICPQLKDFVSLINWNLGFLCPLWDWLEPRHWQRVIRVSSSPCRPRYSSSVSAVAGGFYPSSGLLAFNSTAGLRLPLHQHQQGSSSIRFLVMPAPAFECL